MTELSIKKPRITSPINRCDICGQCFVTDPRQVEVGRPLCKACRKASGLDGIFISTKSGVQ